LPLNYVIKQLEEEFKVISSEYKKLQIKILSEIKRANLFQNLYS